MKKRIIIIVIMIVMVMSSIIMVNAAEETEKALQSDNGAKSTLIRDAYLNLGFSGSNAQVTVDFEASSDADKVRISTYLKKYVNGSWVTLEHWSDTAYTNTITKVYSYPVSSGAQYKAVTYYYAYDGTFSESTSLTDITTY